ncbi:hypothetical protein BH20ACT19_BH20ACT19_03530 [soil metagenome]
MHSRRRAGTPALGGLSPAPHLGENRAQELLAKQDAGAVYLGLGAAAALTGDRR